MSVVVNLDTKRRRDTRPTLDRLNALVVDQLTEVNRVIIDKMDSRVSLIPQLAGHIIAGGGKRLRPMLTLAAARLCGYTGERHIRLAASVEFIHTATLLHDDVVDKSDLRRGNATANSLWDNKASVLVGDFLFSRSFQLMVADGSLRVLKILSDAAATIAEGEVLQLMTSNNTETSEAAHLEVIRAKTAILFAAACRIGAVVAGRPGVEEEALDAYGLNLGIVFQLIDDMLDYSAAEAELELARVDRRRERRRQLPVAVAFLAAALLGIFGPRPDSPDAGTAVARNELPRASVRFLAHDYGPEELIAACREGDSWALVDAYSSQRDRHRARLRGGAASSAD